MADQRITASYSSRYTFTAKEQDAFTGLHYFGARYYDARISLWYGVDPLAEKYPNHSPFNYTLNNPIRLIDPDGKSPEDSDWEPIKNGNLISEIGDNSKTLSKNYNIPIQQAEKMIKDQNLRLNINGDISPNQELIFENQFSEAINNQSQSSIGFKGKDMNDYNNCHGATCNLGGYMNESIIDYHLSNSYNSVNEKSIIPGETVIRWGGSIQGFQQYGSNIAIHTATAYGKNSKG